MSLLRNQMREQLGGAVSTAQEWVDQVQTGRSAEGRWASGVSNLDEVLGGGLARGQFTELIGGGDILSSGRSARGEFGSSACGITVAALLSKARNEGRYWVWIDVGGGLCPEQYSERDLEAVLWLPCKSPKEAVEVFDLVVRDENFEIFCVDFRGCESASLREVPTPAWYRVLQSLRDRHSIGILVGGSTMTSASRQRVICDMAWTLDDLWVEQAELLQRCHYRAREMVAAIPARIEQPLRRAG